MLKSLKLNKFQEISHCFFNRNGGYSNGIYKSLNCGIGSKDKKTNILKNLKKVKEIINCDVNKLILLNQVHSSNIYFVSKPNKKKLIGDGLITYKSGLALGILTADCAPVFIYDKRKKIIGAAHAGWRGAYKLIVIKLIKKFINTGSKKKDLVAVVGPCISQKNYEVKNNFRKKFLKQNPKNRLHFKIKNNKIYFSLSKYIKKQILDMGISKIDVINKDTFDKRNQYFSSRRSLCEKSNDYGRNISIIMIK